MITTGLDREIELFCRHLNVLTNLKENQPLGIIKLSQQLGLPQHKVRYSLRLLEREGLVVPTPGGATLGPKADEFYNEIPVVLRDYYETFKDFEDLIAE